MRTRLCLHSRAVARALVAARRPGPQALRPDETLQTRPRGCPHSPARGLPPAGSPSALRTSGAEGCRQRAAGPPLRACAALTTGPSRRAPTPRRLRRHPARPPRATGVARGPRPWPGTRGPRSVSAEGGRLAGSLSPRSRVATTGAGPLPVLPGGPCRQGPAEARASGPTPDRRDLRGTPGVAAGFCQRGPGSWGVGPVPDGAGRDPCNPAIPEVSVAMIESVAPVRV